MRTHEREQYEKKKSVYAVIVIDYDYKFGRM